MRVLSWIASLGALCMFPASVWAGLVLDLDGKIDAHHINAAEVSGDRVTVVSHGHSHIVRLPEGAGASLMAWASNDTGGPLVFSIDRSLVLTDDHNYAPPSVPSELANLLFQYDAYAAAIACGATSRHQLESHPLVQSAGEGMLPHRVYTTLLDPQTRTPQAISYRRLTERFVHVPACVGELSLYTTPGSDGELVSIQPRSWVHMITYQWYRGIDVPSEADRWVARLPYLPLKQDMEAHWTAYRSAFQPLDALSSIVEAMALLRAIKNDAPSVWAALEQQAPDRRPVIDAGLELPELHAMDPRPWRQLSYAWLGDRVETIAQANLAIGLATAGDPVMLGIEGLDAVAARDPITAAKLQLVRVLFSRSYHRNMRRLMEGSHRVFMTLAEVPGAFRLRATALSLIEARASKLRSQRDLVEDDIESQDTALTAELRNQETALTGDFVHRAESACAANSPDLATWEDLAQDVYSVGLLERFLRDRARLSPRLAAAVACIHVHRGLAPQQGRQLAYRHGHYRFLKYLAEVTDDAQTRKQILQYRRALASTMNLQDSDLGFEVSP